MYHKANLHRIFAILLIFCSPSIIYSQDVTSGFTLDEVVCSDSSFTIKNNSTNAVSYSWDFCEGDLLNTPTGLEISSITNAVGPENIDIITDGTSWYGFIISRNNHKLIRADFGSSINNTPTFNDLGNIEDKFFWPTDIKIIKENNKWYAFVSNSSNLIRLNFGDSLFNNFPTADSLGNFDDKLKSTSGLEFAIDGSNKILLASNRPTGKISVINFGTSILNTPNVNTGVSEIQLTAGGFFRKVSVIKESGNWYGIAVSESGQVSKLSFGNSLLLVPSIDIITNNFLAITFPTDVFLTIDKGKYFAFILNKEGKVSRLNFNTSMSSNFPELTSFDITSDASITGGFAFVKDNSKWYNYSINGSLNKLYKITFPNDCAANIFSSQDFEPSGINYNQQGYHPISLTSYDSLGHSDYFIDSILIAKTPIPLFQSHNNCSQSNVSFSNISTSDIPLTDFSWNFGDSMSSDNLSTLENPTHIFNLPGDYNISLQITDQCGQTDSLTQSIKIYDNTDLQADFSYSNLICSNVLTNFTDISMGTEDLPATYFWDFNGLGPSMLQNPQFTFPSAGNYDVSLTVTGLSSCEKTVTQTITVIESAIPLYTFDSNNTCQNDPITFTNESTGSSITGYTWDFGDSNISTDTSPTHTYSMPGIYLVSLEVTNAAGCVSTYQKEVIVRSLPNTDFSADLACTSQNTQLSDLTTVVGANITIWDWAFGDTASGNDNVSSLENPVHTFSSTGDFNVFLSTTSSYGCENSVEKVVNVLESPIVYFEVEANCVGKVFTFTDLSTPNSGENILSHTWNIDGSIYTAQNPSHIFANSGNFLATLTIRSDNLCTISTTRIITVKELPVVDFSISSICINTEISIEDQTILENDEIVDWQWTINGQDAGNTSKITYISDQSTNQEIELLIITEKGCIVSKTNNITFFDLPVADFDPTPQYSSPSTNITFDNTSKNTVSYLWDFGDGSDTSTEPSPSHIYPNLGIYDVKLTAQSPEGCLDEVVKQIHIVNPEIDLQIDQITSLNNGKILLLTMSNQGTIPINSITATVTFNNNLSINETFALALLPDQKTVSKLLSFTIPNNEKIRFLCISLSTPEGNDDNDKNNMQCINVNSDIEILPPYPNPVSHQEFVAVPIIGEKSDQITISLINPNGKQLFFENITLSQSGLNNFNLSLLSLKPGIYFIQVQSIKSTKIFRIFVN